MKIKKFLKAVSLLINGGGVTFIGDIVHYPFAYEKKMNEWGGYNYKYRVLPRQYVKAISTDSHGGPMWDEVVSLSKHCGIPAYRVVLEDGYEITCSPRRSIMVRDGEWYRTADILVEDIIGMCSPVIGDNGFSMIDVPIQQVFPLGVKMDMWDVTLKDNNVFLADNHMFVFDTVAVHVPVTQGAIKDVFNMMPSNHLIAEQTGKLVAEPEHAAIVGLYNLSKTKEGRERINAILPNGYDISGSLSKKDIIALLERIAKDKGSAASKVINDMRHLGDSAAYEGGITMSLSDLQPLTEFKKEMLPNMAREIRMLGDNANNESLGRIYSKYIDISNKAIDAHFLNQKSDLADIYNSKARGSQSQFRDMILSPISVVSKELSTRPIKNSYTEGLTPAEYFIAAHGARHGVLGRSQGTAEPGALAKEVAATTNTIVVNKAKGTSMGEVEAVIGKWKDSDIIDRYLSKDVVDASGRVIERKDNPVTPKTLQHIKSSGVNSVFVYSPLQSSSADGGLPAMSYGLNSKGVLPSEGENVGVMSAFALVEPLFTGSMTSFHSGGSLSNKKPAYPRIKRILELTKTTPDKATLAEVSGRVSSIQSDQLGGKHVIVGTEEHYVLPQNKVVVSIGDTVKKGDALSDGTIDPRDLASLVSLKAAQHYMVEELADAVPSAKRRALEAVVEGITRHGQIVNAGDSDYLPGDIDLISSIEKKNKNLMNKIEYDYIFKGVNYLPQNTQTWLSKMNFRNIKTELKDDLFDGAETDLSSYEPVPAMAYGIDFGKGDNGKY